MLNHCIIPFGFRKGKTDNFSYHLRAISSFLNKFTKYKGQKKPYLLLMWTGVGGRVCYQARQDFCCVWLELVSNECLGQSGIWTSFYGELWYIWHSTLYCSRLYIYSSKAHTMRVHTVLVHFDIFHRQGWNV